jgi:hypothetical protein
VPEAAPASLAMSSCAEPSRTVMPVITPSLWVNDDLEDVAAFYTGLPVGSEVFGHFMQACET